MTFTHIIHIIYNLSQYIGIGFSGNVTTRHTDKCPKCFVFLIAKRNYYFKKKTITSFHSKSFQSRKTENSIDQGLHPAQIAGTQDLPWLSKGWYTKQKTETYLDTFSSLFLWMLILILENYKKILKSPALYPVSNYSAQAQNL